jgi:hypothetical protein
VSIKAPEGRLLDPFSFSPVVRREHTSPHGEGEVLKLLPIRLLGEVGKDLKAPLTQGEIFIFFLFFFFFLLFLKKTIFLSL